jgi:hypothetical protein
MRVYGAAGAAPAETKVVVPGVTAEMVVVPAPNCATLIFVPIGNATVAFVGIEKVLAVATVIVTSLSASARTAV